MLFTIFGEFQNIEMKAEKQYVYNNDGLQYLDCISSDNHGEFIIQYNHL